LKNFAEDRLVYGVLTFPLSSHPKAIPKTVKIVPAFMKRGSILTVSVLPLSLEPGREVDSTGRKNIRRLYGNRASDKNCRIE
jgi:hypothetical protein